MVFEVLGKGNLGKEKKNSLLYGAALKITVFQDFASETCLDGSGSGLGGILGEPWSRQRSRTARNLDVLGCLRGGLGSFSGSEIDF